MSRLVAAVPFERFRLKIESASHLVQLIAQLAIEADAGEQGNRCEVAPDLLVAHRPAK